MTIWDIMGQKGFRELLKEAYFYGARGSLAVCDVKRRKTLEDLDDWIEGVYSVTGKIPIEFLGNKIDLKDQQQISEDEMMQAARAYDSPFHFTSAKAGVNGEIAFQSLAARVAKERCAGKGGDGEEEVSGRRLAAEPHERRRPVTCRQRA